MPSQITSLMIVYSTVYSGADQRKHQSSASLGFVWGIHRGPVNSPHKWPVTRKMFPFDDVIMINDDKCKDVISQTPNYIYHMWLNVYQQITRCLFFRCKISSFLHTPVSEGDATFSTLLWAQHRDPKRPVILFTIAVRMLHILLAEPWLW